jgi:hypothetical protein
MHGHTQPYLLYTKLTFAIRLQLKWANYILKTKSTQLLDKYRFVLVITVLTYKPYI